MVNIDKDVQAFYDTIDQTSDVAYYCGWTDFDAGGSRQDLDVWLCCRPQETGDVVTIESALVPVVAANQGTTEFFVKPIPVEDLSYDQMIRRDFDLTLVKYKGPWSPEFAGEVQAALLGLAGVIPARKPSSAIYR